MVDFFDNAEVSSNPNPLGLEGNVDVELMEKQQRDEIERQDKLKTKVIEETDKKNQRIAEGREEFEKALK